MPTPVYVCRVCGQCFYTDVAAWEHDLSHDRTHADAPLYVLVTLDEETEQECHGSPSPDHASLRADADWCTKTFPALRFDVALASDVEAQPPASASAEGDAE